MASTRAPVRLLVTDRQPHDDQRHWPAADGGQGIDIHAIAPLGWPDDILHRRAPKMASSCFYCGLPPMPWPIRGGSSMLPGLRTSDGSAARNHHRTGSPDSPASGVI